MVNEDYIIIPPENIYSIDDQKVIDNKVDRIEVSVNTPAIISDTQNVYNENIRQVMDNGAFFGYKQSHIDSGVVALDISGGTGDHCAATYAEITPIYISKTILIPYNIANGIILDILTGIADDGQNQIKVSLYGTVYETSASGQVRVYQDNTVDPPFPVYRDIKNISYTKPTIGDIGYYTIPKNEENQVEIVSYYDMVDANNNHRPSTTKIILNNLDNVNKVTAHPTDDGYQLDLVVLCGYKAITLGGRITYQIKSKVNPNPSNYYTINGIYKEYEPQTINISFYGNTISLDLQENTLSLGNGKQINSYNGNELIQTTNSPSIEETYQQVINKWGKGKELATIKCNIADYFKPNTTAYIDITEITRNIAGEATSVRFDILPEYSKAKTLQSGDILIASGGNIIEVDNQISDYEYEGTVKLDIDLEVAEFPAEVTNRLGVSPNQGGDYLPMSFHIGHICVPYVRGANGKNKPMSLYLDGTPKQFEVVGKKMIYDGAVWQQLTLLEKTE